MPESGVTENQEPSLDTSELLRKTRHVSSDQLVLVGRNNEITGTVPIQPLPEKSQPTTPLPEGYTSSGVLAVPEATSILIGGEPESSDETRLDNGIIVTRPIENLHLPRSAQEADALSGLTIVRNELMRRITKDQLKHTIETKLDTDEHDRKLEEEEKRQQEEHFFKDKENAQKNPEEFLAIKLRTLLTIKDGELDELSNEFLTNLQMQHNQEFPSNEQNFSADSFDETKAEAVAMEKFILQSLSTINDPYTRSLGVSDRLVQSVAVLVRNYTLKSPEQSPRSMPEVANKLFETLDLSRDNKKTRQAAYNLLGQLAVPTETKSKVLWRMEEFGDYSGNHLAARYAESLYVTQPDHPWIVTQTERQKSLLSQLSGTPVELLAAYPELKQAADKIVFHSAPDALPEGKIGFEYEGRLRTKQYKPLSRAWDIGSDLDYTEIRKGYQALYFKDYFHDLVELEAWTRNFYEDGGRSEEPHTRSTMHIHLDKNIHPTDPTIGGLYPTRSKMGTWEERAFLPSKSAAETLAAIALLIGSVGEEHKAVPESESKDSVAPVLSPENADSWRELVWGHTCHTISSPEARLATLVALRDPNTLRVFDLNPLVNTYGPELLDKIDGNINDYILNPSKSDQSLEYILLRKKYEKAIDNDEALMFLKKYPSDHYGHFNNFDGIESLVSILAKDSHNQAALVTLLATENVAYLKKSMIISALGEREEARDLLAPLITLPDYILQPAEKENIVNSLGKYPKYHDQIFPLLFGDTRASDYHLRSTVVERLGKFPETHTKLAPLLFGEMKDSDAKVRFHVANVLSTNPEYDKQFASLLFENNQNEPVGILKNAVEALADNNEYQDRLVSLLFDENTRATATTQEDILENLIPNPKYRDQILSHLSNNLTTTPFVHQNFIRLLSQRYPYIARYIYNTTLQEAYAQIKDYFEQYPEEEVTSRNSEAFYFD